MEKNNEIRKDLNEIVKGIELKKVKTPGRTGYVKYVAFVKLYNDVVIEFNDKNGFFELLTNYEKAGYDLSKIVKKPVLAEEEKTENNVYDFEENSSKARSTYICVKYEIDDGDEVSVHRLFPNRFNDVKAIDIFYKKFKEQKKSVKENKVNA